MAINSVRSRQEHDGITSSMFMFLTLGHSNVVALPEYRALLYGFNIHIGSRAVLDIDPNMSSLKGMVSLHYNRYLKSSVELIHHLTFITRDPLPDQIAEDEEFGAAFESSLFRYLRGRGHPSHPFFKDLLSERTVLDSAQDDTLRGALLLHVATQSSFLPLDPGWSLTVSSQCPIIISSSNPSSQTVHATSPTHRR